MGCLDVFLECLKDTGKGKRFKNQTALAKQCGVLPGQVNKWILGKGLSNLEKNFTIIDKLGCHLLPPDQGLDGFDLVPKVAARCGAGASLETSDAVQSMHAFRSSFFGRINISAKNAVMMDVTGDSMEPTLYSGDTVLIDKSDIDVRDGYMYVVTLGDELRIKRVQKEVGGIRLISDNSRYAPILITPDIIDQLVVHGRVRWIGRIV